MQNIKSSKRVIISVIVISILFLAVTITSYAFFNYYKTGEKDNLLVTGRIKLSFLEGDDSISLTNQFPMSDEEAVNEVSNDTEVVSTSFTISGYAGNNTSLRYRIFGIKGDDMLNMTRMSDEHIKLYLTENHDYGEVIIKNDYNKMDDVNGIYGNKASIGRGEIDTLNGGEIELADGIVSTEISNHTYTLRMWISDDVGISDTDETQDYCALLSECVGSRPLFDNAYYSLKIRVQNIETD